MFKLSSALFRSLLLSHTAHKSRLLLFFPFFILLYHPRPYIVLCQLINTLHINRLSFVKNQLPTNFENFHFVKTFMRLCIVALCQRRRRRQCRQRQWIGFWRNTKSERAGDRERERNLLVSVCSTFHFASFVRVCVCVCRWANGKYC